MGGVVVVGGYAYVGTTGSIRKVDVSTGAVTTLAGDPISTGCTDSPALFRSIYDLATDGTNLYAAQPDCATGLTIVIRKIDISSGATSTLATGLSGSGFLTYDSGYLYLSGYSITKVNTSSGSTSPFSATPGNGARGIVSDGTYLWLARLDGTGSSIQQITISSGAESTFTTATDTTFASDAIESAGSSLYFESGWFLRRMDKSTGAWSNIAGIGQGNGAPNASFEDGVGMDAWFSSAVTGIGTDGTKLYIADSNNWRLRVATPGTAWSAGQPTEYSTTIGYPASAELKTVAGSGSASNTNGTGATASFNYPSGAAIVGGYAYVGSVSAIRKINMTTGAVTTLAGNLSTTGCNDSSDPTQVGFNGVGQIVTDGHFLYEESVTCTSGGVIRRTSVATGATSTVTPTGPINNLTIGPDGALYFTDSFASDITRVDPVTGAVTNPIPSFSYRIAGITADANYLWVTASNTGGSSHASAVYRVTTAGTVTTVASHALDTNLAIGRPASAGDYLYGISYGGAVLQQIRKSDGTLRSILGSTPGFADGVGTSAQFQGYPNTSPAGLVSDGSTLWMSDSGNNRFRKIGPTSKMPDPSGCNCGKRVTSHPVDLDTGNYFTSATDVAIPGRSPALTVTRTFSSQDASYNGPFGYGWMSNYDMHLEFGILSGPSPVDVVQENGSRISYTWNGSSYDGPTSDFATLVHNGSGTWTFTRRNQEQFVFDSNGLLIQEIARSGFAGSPGPTVAAAYTTTLTYSSGKLATVADAAGRTLTYTFTGNHVTGIADSTGRSIAYSYDGSGNLTDVTDVGGGNTHFTYYSDHTMHTVRDPRGHTVETMVYDSSGRVTSQTDAVPARPATTFDYTSIPGSTKMTDPRGNVTVDTFTNGLITSEIKGYGTADAATWQYSYDQTTLGYHVVTDPNSNHTTYTWDATTGQPLTITDDLSHETVYTYNSFGEPLTVQDPNGVAGAPNGVTTTNTYDSAGNLTQTSTPLAGSGTNQVTVYTHGDASHPGDVTSITDPRSKVWPFTYDASTGDLLSTATPLGDKTTYTYNAAGQRLTMVTPNGNVLGGTPATYRTSYVPDAFGDVTSITDPLGHQTQQVYDADRNIHQVIDPLTQTTTYDYDNANELTTVTRADTPPTTLQNAYFDDGTLKSQTDGNGKVTQYDYTHRGQLKSVTDPNSRTTNYTYDLGGRLSTVQDPATRVTTNAYDVANRLTSVSYSDGVTPNVAYTYDADGQRLTMDDGTGHSTWAWDSLHRLTSQKDGASQTTGYGYDLANNLTSIAYPGGTLNVTRGFDDSSRLHTVSDGTHTTTFDYDHNDNLTTETYPNSTVATYTPDAADRLMNIADTKSATTFASFGYTRNANDEVTAVTPTGVGQSNQSYGYSALNQLNSENGSSYTFDSADNMTGNPAGTKLAFDDANQLCWTSTSTGPCASPPGTKTSYGYDSLGERTSMTPPSGNPAVTYGYDQAQRLNDLRGGEYRTAVLAANPGGYWRLSDASGSTAADASGYGRTGTYQGASSTTTALTTDSNAAASFTGGSASDMYLPANTSFDFSTNRQFTLEAWVNASTTQINGAGVIARGVGGGGEQYAIDVASGKYRFFVRNSAGTATNLSATSGPTGSGWQHVVGVFDQAVGRMEIWINGVLSASTTPPTSLLAAASQTVVGARKSGSDTAGSTTYSNALNGKVDEAAIYPRALTSDEIAGHYRAGLSNYSGTIASDAPITYWRLDDVVASGTANDSSGNGHNGGTYSATGVTSITTDSATYGVDSNKSASFDGSTGWLHGAGTKISTPSFSAEAWIKTSISGQVTPTVISSGYTHSTTQNVNLGLDSTGTKARWAIRDDASASFTVTGTTTVKDGNWHHIVGTYDSATQATRLYVDGQLDGSGTKTFGAMTLDTSSVGTLSRNGAQSFFFSGKIDDAALYPYALDATSVSRHYFDGTSATPKVGNYVYDGDGRRTAKSIVGHKTSYSWLQSQGLPLMSGDGTNQYIYGPGGMPLAQVTGSTVVYYHQDQQGSTRALTDSSGNVLSTFSGDAYGTATSVTGLTQTPLRYDGQYTDSETGFQYLRARYYDPTTAAFLSRDPLDAATRSAYGYAGGNAVSASDPTGMSLWDSVTDTVDDLGDDWSAGMDELTSDFSTGWDSMPTWAKVADATLPITLPLAAAACFYWCLPAAVGLGPLWQSLVTSDETGAVGAGWPAGPDCVENALEIQGDIGGEIYEVTQAEGLRIGPSVNDPDGSWYFHAFVVKNGMAYDAATGRSGMPLEAYKEQFEYAKDLIWSRR